VALRLVGGRDAAPRRSEPLPMLYVVALPVLADKDRVALERLRAQYHPTEAGLIGPHFTLIFGAAPEEEQTLAAALAAVAAAHDPFWFRLDRLSRFDHPPPSKAAWLYALPHEGAGPLVALHDALNPHPTGPEFEPHLTLGLFDSAAEAERVARIVGRQHLPIDGRVERLALLRRDGDTLTAVASAELGAT